MSWRDFWNGEHAIYVSPRHKTLHYRQIATDLIAHIPSPEATVLDHGCGEALDAARVAAACGKLFLCEAAPNVRDKLRGQFGRLDSVMIASPEEVAALPDATFDLVVANSLIQYLSRDELKDLLATWHRRLKPGAALVLADVIPPDVSPLTDATQLLAFGWRGGFFLAALAGLVCTVFSDYRKLRAQYGLSTYTPEAIGDLLREARFVDIQRPANFGHNPHRMTFKAVRPA